MAQRQERNDYTPCSHFKRNDNTSCGRFRANDYTPCSRFRLTPYLFSPKSPHRPKVDPFNALPKGRIVTDLRFLRVLSRRCPAREPMVIAVADEHLVKFSRRDGWTCDCDLDGDECPHVDAVAELLDDRVIGEAG